MGRHEFSSRLNYHKKNVPYSGFITHSMQNKEDSSTSAVKNPFVKSEQLFWFLGGIALLVGVLHATSLAFVNDDAFISFRYAKNFVNGLGLVFNAGERVEGFTNFLWTIIIALGMKFHLDPVNCSMTLGIFFYAFTLLLFVFLSWRLRLLSAIPLTAVALCAHRDFSAYATSGLETMMFTFFVSAGFVAVLFSHTHWKLIGAGFLFVLVMMTRPDGTIYLIAAILYLLLTPFLNDRKWTGGKNCVLFLLPTIFLFIPYWLLRWLYYGYFFPNPFYAKSIDLPYYSQGLIFTWMFLKTYYVFLLLPILGFILLTSKQSAVDSSSLKKTERPILLASLFIVLQTLFIIRIGGDFIFARFFVPITPLLFFILEHLVSRATAIAKEPSTTRIVFAILIVLATLFRYDQFTAGAVVGYIADEVRYYPPEHLQQSQAHGALFHKYFGDLPVRVAFWGGQSQLTYYSDPAYALEGIAGLTDSGIAHQPLITRGRPGHEKQASQEYLVAKKINFFIGPVHNLPPNELVLNAIVFDSLVAKIIVYDNAIMPKLAQYPGVRFVQMPKYLDAYIAALPTRTREDVARDYAFFKSFYFEYNNDPERERAFISFLGNHSLAR